MCIGMYWLDILTNTYRILSNCGTYAKVSDLLVKYSPFNRFVFTQDDKGHLYIIYASS